MREFTEDFINDLSDRSIPAVCVSIMGKSAKEISENLANAKLARPDCLEFRADTLKSLSEAEISAPMIGKGSGGLPIILTIRSKKEGGLASLSDEEYTGFLVKAAKENWADLIDVECIDKTYDVKKLISDIHEAGAGVIGSYHDFDKTPSVEKMVEILTAEASLGADVIKAAFMPQSKTDVLHLMEATIIAKENTGKSVVTMAMGDIGRISRLTGGFTGSCITFGAAAKASAPGQIGALYLKKELCELFDLL